MIEPKQVINFIPPKLDGDFFDKKRRYMLVAKNDNYIEMINISKIQGKDPKIFIRDYNVKLKNHNPFKLPSFAKVNTLYKIKYFPEIEKFISFGGKKLNDADFDNILFQRRKYIEKTGNENIIFFSKEEFFNKNKIEVMT